MNIILMLMISRKYLLFFLSVVKTTTPTLRGTRSTNGSYIYIVNLRSAQCRNLQYGIYHTLLSQLEPLAVSIYGNRCMYVLERYQVHGHIRN